MKRILAVAFALLLPISVAADVVRAVPPQAGASGGGGGISFGGASGGTANRCLFTDGSGNLADDADCTFITDTLTVTKIGTTTLTGTNVATGRTTFSTAADAANAVDLGETAGRITFEGATADAFETRLGATDPTVGDGVILLPNLAAATTDTLVTLALAQELSNKTLASFELGTGATDTTITRASAGVVAVEGVSLLSASNSVASITGKGFTSFELGAAATDTTITRSAAGTMAIEGVDVMTQTNTMTGITNKTFVAPVLGAATGTSVALANGPITVKSTGSGTPTIFTVPANTTVTGANNILVGSGAGAAITSGARNLAVGDNTGDALTSLNDDVFIGHNAGTGSAVGGQNTVIGSTAFDATTSTLAVDNVCVGFDSCGAITQGNSNTYVGSGAGNTLTSGIRNVGIGFAAGQNVVTSTVDTIAIGWNAFPTASNQAVIGGGSFISDYYLYGPVQTVTVGSATVHASGGNGGDSAGSAMILAGGQSTGTALGGSVQIKTTPSSTTSSTLNTLANRDYIYAGVKALTAASATNVVRVALAGGSVAGGIFQYCVRADDATNYLVRCGDVEWAAVNKAGTLTCTVGVVGGGDVCADTVTPGTCAISTLTAAFTCVSNSANTVDIQINAAAAITETTLNVGWRLTQDYGAGAVTPQ